MRNKIIIGVVAVAVAVVAAVNVNIALQDNSLSALALANIEVLAQETNGNNNTWQEGTKTITVTRSQWTYEVTTGWWIFKSTVKYTMPGETETITFKCCREKGPLSQCFYETC
jgi:archaellum component FlaF (FlaF/FlaG flagellin family)